MEFTYSTEIVFGSNSHELWAAKYLADRLHSVLGIKPRLIPASGVCGDCRGKIFLKISNDLFCDEKNEEIRAQGYEIDVQDNCVTVSACGKAGLLYGCVELVRIIKNHGAVLSEMVISELPKLANRGFYHDATRGRIQTIESYKKLIDHMVELKLNQLQLYVEHTYKFSFLSEVWKDNTPLTAEDIIELDSYCKERCIDFVPSISTFGHLYSILRSKEYCGLCELPGMENDRFSFDDRMAHHTLDVTNPDSIKLVERMLHEFMPLFSSKYVNICADETFDLGKGRSKEYVDRVGEAGAYVGFLKRILAIVIDAGRIPMFWGDILAKFPEYGKELPKEVICLNWGYSEWENEDRASKYAELGLNQYLCPGVHGWRHSINRLDNGFKNIALMNSFALKYNALGLLNTDWGDYGHYNDPAFSLPGMAYGAYMSWYGAISENEADTRIAKEIYGDASGTIISLMKQLAKLETVTWERFVLYKESSEAGRPAEALKERFKNELSADCTDENEMSKKLCTGIIKMLPFVNETGKILINRLVLFAEGQRLINDTMKAVGDKYEGKNTAPELPSALEKYVYNYRQNWYETSREAELKRIEEVFFFYADLLKQQ